MNIAQMNSIIPNLDETVAKTLTGNGNGMDKAQPGKEGFSTYLSKSLAEVNSLLGEADQKSIEMALGKSENLHDAMITFEKAETAMKLLVQVRNKALEAYHEVMRMQV